jgi:hypothetical protein
MRFFFFGGNSGFGIGGMNPYSEITTPFVLFRHHGLCGPDVSGPYIVVAGAGRPLPVRTP